MRNEPFESGRESMRGRGSVLTFILLGALALRAGIVLMGPGYPADQAQFVQWAYLTKSEGLAGVYRLRPGSQDRYLCNYPPLYLYVLRSLAALQDTSASPDKRLTADTARAIWQGDQNDHGARFACALHKLPGIIADAILAVLLCRYLWRRWGLRTAIFVGIAYGLLPGAWHNCAVWGQVDSILALLLVLSAEAAARKRIIAMSIWAALAMLFKAQAVILLPVWCAVLFVAYREDRIRAVKGILSGVAVTVVVMLPFLGTLDGVRAAYFGAANFYPFTHLNGFSAWFLTAPLAEPQLGGNLMDHYVRDNAQGFLGIAPRYWGFAGVLAMWIRAGWEIVRCRADAASIFRAARILTLGFFVLSTQMHERYLFPAVALWAWAAIPSRRWWGEWLIIGLCASLNEIWAWPGPPGGNIVEEVRTLLHTPAVGVGCSILLVIITALTAVGWETRAKSS